MFSTYKDELRFLYEESIFINSKISSVGHLSHFGGKDGIGGFRGSILTLYSLNWKHCWEGEGG